MKKAYLKSVLILCLLALAACGKKTEEESRYYNVQVESGGQLEEVESGQFLLGQQYYRGAPVSLIAETSSGETADTRDLSLRPMDVYIRPMGGDKQLLMGGVSGEYRCRGWYLDEKGRCFVRTSGGITRLDGDGKALYHSPLSDIVLDMCCTEGDRLILLTQKADGGLLLVNLDPDTGKTSPIENISLDFFAPIYISSLGDDLLVLDKGGVWQVDLKKGTKDQRLSFQGTAFSIETIDISDFWSDGNGADILWSSGRSEHLALTDINSEKEIITVRVAYPDMLKEALNLFNQSSDTYYAVLEESGFSQWDDYLAGGGLSTAFQTETNLKLTSGKGADIICSDALFDDISAYMEKGVFVDLAPLMEASGIREEDYFRAAFDAWRDGDKIYGIAPYIDSQERILDRTVLNGREDLTIETFVGALLEFEEDRCLAPYYNSVDILDYFLEGSGDLWGMVDWEKGTCDFNGELFSKMLLAAKRYGAEKARKQYPALFIGSGRSTSINIYDFNISKKLEANNQIPLGWFFDDGIHPRSRNMVIMGINAASEHVEGAMQLLAFLLEEEAQSTTDFYLDPIYPVNKMVFDKQAQAEMEYVTTFDLLDGSNSFLPGRNLGRDRGGCTVLEEQVVTEFRQMLFESRFIPYKTAPLLSIIREEAAYYFNGSKSMEDVIAVIQNRVQLYLDEH